MVEDDVSGPGMSVLAGAEKSPAAADMIPPDQAALGMSLLATMLLRLEKVSRIGTGSLAAIVVRVASDSAVGTHGAMVE